MRGRGRGGTEIRLWINAVPWVNIVRGPVRHSVLKTTIGWAILILGSDSIRVIVLGAVCWLSLSSEIVVVVGILRLDEFWVDKLRVDIFTHFFFTE